MDIYYLCEYGSYEACPKSKFSYLQKNVERNLQWLGIARNVAYASVVTL